MHFMSHIIISLASVAPLAAAFTLPAGLTSGTYAAYYNARGEEVHVKASELDKRDIRGYTPAHRAQRSNANVVGKRQDLGDSGYSVYCGCGFYMDHGDCDAAVAGLEAQFPSSLDGGLSWYTISNSVVAFLCTGETHLDVGGADPIVNQFQIITEACGSYVAGTFYTDPSGHETGYMNYYAGLDFCAAATGSTLESC